MVGEDTSLAGAQQQQLLLTEIDQSIKEAPVMLVDGAQSLAMSGGLIRFNFFQDLLLSGVAESPIRRVVSARIVMQPQVLVQFYDWLSESVEKIRAEMPLGGGDDGAEPPRE